MYMVYLKQEGSLITDAMREHDAQKVFALFSGGHDSLCSTHVASQHPEFAGAIHCNTGIGIPETTAFVRDTCEQHGWPLYEYHARERNDLPIYDDMCLRLGMPGGPMAHSSQYHVLKEEQITTAVREHRVGDSPVGLVTGIRKKESVRRMHNVISTPSRLEDKKHRLWINPILEWSALDVNQYIVAEGLTRNLVVDLIHRSGECLCGALARPEELKEIAYWFPEVGARIYSLEKQCYDKRLPFQWGQKKVVRPPIEQMELPMCQSCETRWEE
jgi:3'-phosphoadenosine 5'-phosphosulfate sulfotransferase (PAPS reductase)/FAD synthetase